MSEIAAEGKLVFRHRVSTRVWHWINVVALTVMFMSGLMIFNAHPQLYWGQYGGSPADLPWLSLPRFPSWATIPGDYSLALGRLWHFAFAWVFAFGFFGYLVWSLFNGHFRKDVALSAAEIAPSHLWADVKKHAKLDFHSDDARYNPLQKITYSLVLFGLIPLAILTGLTMSPGMNAALPWLVELFGGRQSARSLHFIAAFGFVGFVTLHVTLVILAGPINEMRSMTTGWFRLGAVKP